MLIIAGAITLLALLYVLGIAVFATSRSRSFSSIPAYDPNNSFSPGLARGRPMIGNGSAYFFSGTELVARDLRTELDLWRVPVPCAAADSVDWAETIRSTAINPLVIRCGNDLHALDWSSGRQRWSAVLSAGPANFVRSSPTILAFGYATEVVVFDMQTGAELWRKYIPKVREDTHPIAVTDTHLYVGEDRQVKAYDARTGLLAWTQLESAASIASSTQGLFIRTDGHTVLSLNPETGATIWSTGNDDPRLSWSLVVGTTGPTLILRNRAGTIVAYDTATGAELWSSKDSVTTTPGTGASTTRVEVPRTIAPDTAEMTMSYGGGYVVTTGVRGLYVIDATSGVVVDRDTGASTSRAAVDEGFFAYVDYGGDLVVAPLP